MLEMVGVGDLHQTDDKGHGGLAKYIENPDLYIWSEVDRVCKWARKRSIQHVVLYGDICDNPRMSYPAMLAFEAGVRRNKDLQFIVYRGNHDSLAKDWREGHSLEIVQKMKLPNLQVIVEDTYLEFGKQRIKIVPWPSKAFDKTCLNFGHTEVQGSQLDTGRKIEGDEYSKTKAVICMGHLHTNHRVRNTFYSGTLYQTNFGESLPKFFHHIRYKSLEDYEIESIPFDPLYKLFNCVVESKADIDALPTDPHHLIKLVVKDGVDIEVPNRPNIVINKSYKTKDDLTQILVEDLMTGEALVLKTSEFFQEWIKQQSIPQSLKKQAAQIRKRVLNAARNR